MKKRILSRKLSVFTFSFLISVAYIIFGTRVELIKTHQRFLSTFKVSNNMATTFAQEDTETTNKSESTGVESSSSEAKDSITIVQPVPITENTIVKLLTLVLIGVLVLIVILLSPVAGFKFWQEDQENLDSKADFLSESFPKLLEGITVILIVMVVTILTLSGFVKEQGTISILSALIGYVLGKKTGELENSPSRQTLSSRESVSSDTLSGSDSDTGSTEDTLPSS